MPRKTNTQPTIGDPKSKPRRRAGVTIVKDAPDPAEPKTVSQAEIAAKLPEADALLDAAAAEPAKAPEPIPPASQQGQAAVTDAARRAQAPPTPVELFQGGKTIAEIARGLKMSHGDVRELLDDASIDYSKDKNAAAARPPASGSGAPTARVAKTQAERLEAFITKAATGELSAKKRKLADALKDNAEVADYIAGLAGTQRTDQEAYGRMLGALAAFLWSCES